MLHVGVDRRVHGVDVAGVAPAALALVVLGRVLRVVDQEVRVAHELGHAPALLLFHRFQQRVLVLVELVAHRVDALVHEEDLVVGAEQDDLAVDLDAVTEGQPRVMQHERRHGRRSDADRVVMRRVVAHRREPCLGLDREVRGAHLLRDVLLELVRRAARPVDVDLVARGEGRREERQPRDVIPVEVGEEHAQVPALRVAHHGLSERDDAGARVEQDHVAAEPQLHARRVAANLHVACERSGVRAPHAPEAEVVLRHSGLQGYFSRSCAPVYFSTSSRMSCERTGLIRYSSAPSLRAMARS